MEQAQKKEPKKKKKKKNAAKMVENNREVMPENGSAITEIVDNDNLNGEVDGIDKVAPARTGMLSPYINTSLLCNNIIRCFLCTSIFLFFLINFSVLKHHVLR